LTPAGIAAWAKQKKNMRIQVNSDSNIAVDTRVITFVADEVNRVLNRFANKLTRVEVHLSDVNSHKFGASDKRCVIEARPARHQPLTVSNGARTVKQSVGGALTKMRSSLQTFFGRLGKQQYKDQGGAVKRAQSPVAPIRQGARKETASKAAIVDSGKRSSVNGHSPKKKGIYQARRKSWPTR
jgi:hypothetical protein